MITIYVGFDQRESVAYHTFCQSVIDASSEPVSFRPLSLQLLRKQFIETHSDGSNDFIYSRFLVPHLNEFSGWAIFADGDMICRSDVSELWRLRDHSKAIQVVKHDYVTKRSTKYLNNKNENYPRKNWSSVILWNCAHPAHRVLTPDFVAHQTGSYLHRFNWLQDDLIGELPVTWNWLDIEYPENERADLVHYTLGTPCFKDFRETKHASEWFDAYHRAIEGFDDSNP